jgi:hypothetical protein
VITRELPFEVPTLDLQLFWRRDTAEEAGLRWAREQLLRAGQA